MAHLEIIQRYHQEIWQAHHHQAVHEFFHPHAQIHSPVETVEGPAKMQAVLELWHQAFPDLKVHWEQFICEGNKVVSHWRAEGTHTGPFLTYAPSHKKVSYSGVTIYELEADKISQYWAVVNMYRLIEQIK